MSSLYARVTLAALLVLALFLGLTGWTLDRAFRDSAEAAVRERLQAQIYGLLAAADLDAEQQLRLPESLPEERFQRPGSGLYAQVLGADGGLEWQSPSQLLQAIPVPARQPPGQWQFGRVRNPGGAELFQLAFGLAWELPQGTVEFTIGVSEDLGAYRVQVDRFRHSLLGWFAALALGLLVALGLVLRWGLRPLRQVERDLAAVERGAQAGLAGRYPRELRGLTENLNALLATERGRLQRYRDGLADLAHSLKTPLAILRGGMESQADAVALRGLIREQTERMGQIMDYQLQRAATSGRSALLSPVPIAPLLQRLRQTLDKVYAQRGLQWELQVDPALQFRADEADLLEICGNLMDNACKWAASRILVGARRYPVDGRQALEIRIEDDGPGIPDAQRTAVLERGIRVDSSVPGQGIGLAVVQDVVSAYGGQLRIERSPQLRGNRVSLVLFSG